ncbi:MAG: helix-turn-helix transcriptional regulator [Bacillota bacterium]
MVCATNVISASLIAERRLARGLTQEQLASRVLMTKTQISDYENLRNIMSVAHAKRIADVLGCSIEDLYAWKESDADGT